MVMAGLRIRLELRWGGNILFTGFSFRPNETIKTISNISGAINFNGDTLETSQLSAHLGSSILFGKGKLIGFTNPSLSLVFSSPSLDPADFGLLTPQKGVRLTKVQGNIALQNRDLQIKSFTTHLNRSIFHLKGSIRDLDNPSIE